MYQVNRMNMDEEAGEPKGRRKERSPEKNQHLSSLQKASLRLCVRAL
jgi:hypothetical protein